MKIGTIKVIAIGNRLMGDDGIALYVAESLSEDLNSKGVDVIIGETDVEFCLSRINEEDFIIIIDSSYQEAVPGKVNVISLDKIKSLQKYCCSQHQPNLIKLLDIYRLKNDGRLISIEAADINFRYGLSDVLNKDYIQIVNQVKDILYKILEELRDA